MVVSRYTRGFIKGPYRQIIRMGRTAARQENPHDDADGNENNADHLHYPEALDQDVFPLLFLKKTKDGCLVLIRYARKDRKKSCKTQGG